MSGSETSPGGGLTAGVKVEIGELIVEEAVEAIVKYGNKVSTACVPELSEVARGGKKYKLKWRIYVRESLHLENAESRPSPSTERSLDSVTA